MLFWPNMLRVDRLKRQSRTQYLQRSWLCSRCTRFRTARHIPPITALFWP